MHREMLAVLAQVARKGGLDAYFVHDEEPEMQLLEQDDGEDTPEPGEPEPPDESFLAFDEIRALLKLENVDGLLVVTSYARGHGLFITLYVTFRRDERKVVVRRLKSVCPSALTITGASDLEPTYERSWSINTALQHVAKLVSAMHPIRITNRALHIAIAASPSCESC